MRFGVTGYSESVERVPSFADLLKGSPFKFFELLRFTNLDLLADADQDAELC